VNFSFIGLQIRNLFMVANLRHVEKTQLSKRTRRQHEALVQDTLIKYSIPSNVSLRFFAEVQRRTTAGILVKGTLLIFKFQLVFRPDSKVASAASLVLVSHLRRARTN